MNEVDKNKQTDKDTANISDTHKSKCVNEKQNNNDKSQDKHGSNVVKTTTQMNDNYDKFNHFLHHKL